VNITAEIESYTREEIERAAARVLRAFARKRMPLAERMVLVHLAVRLDSFANHPSTGETTDA